MLNRHLNTVSRCEIVKLVDEDHNQLAVWLAMVLKATLWSFRTGVPISCLLQTLWFRKGSLIAQSFDTFCSFKTTSFVSFVYCDSWILLLLLFGKKFHRKYILIKELWAWLWWVINDLSHNFCKIFKYAKLFWA